jgi:hypothetical protein
MLNLAKNHPHVFIVNHDSFFSSRPGDDMRITTVVFVCFGWLFLAGIESAKGTVIYDGTIAWESAGTGLYANQWYFDGLFTDPERARHFSIAQGSGIEIAIRARTITILDSATGFITPTGNVYTVSTGLTVHGNAKWAYEYVINLSPNGLDSGLHIGDTDVFLTVTDLATNTSATVDPLTYWTTNAGYSWQNGFRQPTPDSSTDTEIQNRALPGVNFPTGSFNPLDLQTYRFDLEVRNKATDALLASDTMFVQVPEPSSFVITSWFMYMLLRSRKR